MNELSMELKQQLEEAAKDMQWLEKFRLAVSYEEYEALLAEKGIEITAEVKELFSSYLTSKTGELVDEELDKVAGGFNFFPCEGQYNYILCYLTSCPHLQKLNQDPKARICNLFCDEHFWWEYGVPFE